MDEVLLKMRFLCHGVNERKICLFGRRVHFSACLEGSVAIDCLRLLNLTLAVRVVRISLFFCNESAEGFCQVLELCLSSPLFGAV